jgi:hypothetical protein
MADATPQIADVVPQTPTMAPTALASDVDTSPGSAIGKMMAPTIEAANQKIPDPYTQGVQVAEPHQKQIVPATQYDANHPVQGSAWDKAHARRQNSVAGLANVIGQFGQQIQEKKQANLKDKLVNVMKYKTNTENAQQVLNDPNSSPQAKQMAQRVADANKKQLNDLLSDKKNQKEMAKALDISFVDPDKNKTPEVQAYQQAMKEFKGAGPFTSDNPQEHVVAQAAQKVAAPVSRPGVSGGSPEQVAAPVQRQAPPAPLPPPKSQTPYADAALAKDSPTIEENPKYAAALIQKDAANKQLMTAIPHLIDSAYKTSIANANNKSSAARVIFDKLSDARKQQLSDISKLTGIGMRDRTMLSVQASRAATDMAKAHLQVNAAMSIANMKNLTEQQKIAVLKQGLAPLDKQMAAVSARLENYDKSVAAMKAVTPKEDQASALQTLAMQRQMDSNELDQLQQMRTGATSNNQLMVDDASSSKTPISPEDREIQSFMTSGPQPGSGEPSPEIQLIGADPSDNPSDNPDAYLPPDDGND